jgi:hypothetical protein
MNIEERNKRLIELLEEVVDKVGYILQKGILKYGESGNETSSILCLRQMFDLSDGACILINHNSNDSAISVIRSLFEVEVGLEYLLQEDMENRNLQFLFYYNKKKEEELLSNKSGTERHKTRLNYFLKDKNIDNKMLDDFRNSQINEDDLTSVQHTLKYKGYRKFRKYYDRKDVCKKYWFSLLNGPKSIKELVEKVGMHSQYEVNYTLWSSISHGWDIVNRHLIFNETHATVISKRNPIGFLDNVMNTIAITRRGILKYTLSRLPELENEIMEWYYDFYKRYQPLYKDF